MKRREFLIRSVNGGSLLLILPVGWTVAGCGGGGYGPGTTNVTTGNSLLFTSSVVGGHSHDFNIDMVDLMQPPAAGIADNTSTSSNHMHTVSLSASELSQIKAGQTITKDTSTMLSHLHTFQFSLAAGTSTNGTAGTTGTAGTSGTAGTTGTAGTGSTSTGNGGRGY